MHDRRSRVLLVANGSAGATSRELVAAVERRCAPLAVATLRWTAEPDDATRIVRAEVLAAARATGDPPLAAIVSVGGDGTAREVAEGLAGAIAELESSEGIDEAVQPARTVPSMLVIPGGTGNSVYRELWGDAPWEDVVEPALHERPAHTHRIDLAAVTGTGDPHVMLLGASAGFLAEVVAAAAHSAHTGRARYQAAAMDALGEHRPFPARVLADDRLVIDDMVDCVVVGGAQRRGGTFHVLPESVLDDGLLEVCVLAASTPERFGTLLVLAAGGRHLGEPDVLTTRCTRIVIERTDGRPLAFEHDGDLCEVGARAVVDILPAALPVLAAPDSGLH